MPESKHKKLPQFNYSQELVEFFDTHDLGECQQPTTDPTGTVGACTKP